ncbi:MAG: beta-ketoacyl-[acyl-carrier-protein] synthase family protein [Muribaculaceae bacterium]|nr:beta-ketoacyl-[acyl-carrier-protein] synthase family protein [Muribaculaceae bacterium]
MAERVLITGYGIISALGAGIEATLDALKTERSGIDCVKYLETNHRELPVGEVKYSNAKLAKLLNAKYPVSELRTVMLGIIAAKEAVTSAKLSEDDIRNAALISGTTVGGMDFTEKHFNEVLEREADTLETEKMKYNDCGCSTELIADAIGKVKMITTSSTACSSAANAIILGANLIKSGVVDIAIVGGSEALTRFHLNGFNTLMILDKSRCRPFDETRTGINLGEGAAYLILENEKSAHRRGIKALAELKGYGNACDAFHQTASSDNGEGAYRAMSQALMMAQLKPTDIDYINAHGTGTPNNDRSELAAMERIWGASLPKFSSTKAFTGHTTSASGAIESVISILCLQHKFAPANIGWESPIKDFAVPVTQTSTAEIKNIINNSFGFGGNDSSLIFSNIN